MTALAALSGLLVVGGIALAIGSWKRVPVEVKAPTVARTTDPLLTKRLVAAVGGCLLILILTRWPVLAIAGAIGGWFLAGPRERKARETAEQRTEAIALWAEMLRDTVGTSRGIEGILVATAMTAPLAIRPELSTMAARLQREPLNAALDGLAADLDHPLGDLVVTALRLTSVSGGDQLSNVLNSLAETAYAEAESNRRIEVARQRPRAAMRYTAMIVGAFVTGLALLSRSYLKPYNSVLGQLVLLVVGLYWAAGFWWMHRMSKPEPVERFLSTSALPGVVR